MANLANRDSLFNELFDFRRDFDQLFNRFLSASPSRWEGRNRASSTGLQSLIPAVNAYVDRNDKKFYCEVALPGIDPNNVDIQVQGNVLSIRGERQLRNESKEADFVYKELVYGSFERDIPLPEGVDREKISAEYRNGVLEITSSISTAALPRRIEIRGGQERQERQERQLAGASSSSR